MGGPGTTVRRCCQVIGRPFPAPAPQRTQAYLMQTRMNCVSFQGALPHHSSPILGSVAQLIDTSASPLPPETESRPSLTLVNDHTPADHSLGGTLATGRSCLGEHVTTWPGDPRGGQNQGDTQFLPACRGAMSQPTLADVSPQGGVKSCLFLL